MQPTASAAISNDITFTLISSQISSQYEASALGYSVSLVNGITSGAIDMGVLASGTLPSSGKEVFDFTALSKKALGVEQTVNFNKIKGIAIQNREITYGNDINVHATGSNAFTGLFNGESGNFLIKPYAVDQYTDMISGTNVGAGNSELTIQDVSGAGAKWTMIVVGITGS